VVLTEQVAQLLLLVATGGARNVEVDEFRAEGLRQGYDFHTVLRSHRLSDAMRLAVDMVRGEPEGTLWSSRAAAGAAKVKA
jgi:hypothetical protein